MEDEDNIPQHCGVRLPDPNHYVTESDSQIHGWFWYMIDGNLFVEPLIMVGGELESTNEKYFRKDFPAKQKVSNVP